MIQYHAMLAYILGNGKLREDRTGTGTLSVFGYQNRYDLSKGFPLVNSKKMSWNVLVHELLWFLSGETNIDYLKENGVSIWDEWANEHGDLGPVYGHQWRSWTGASWESHDQIAEVIDQIKTNPSSRRLIVSAWNVDDVPTMALPPCHLLFQFYVDEGKLSCQLYQRSADAFLGVPYNIASYALLTHMIAHVTGLKVGEFIHTFGDLHIYQNHIDQVQEQLSRNILPLPTVEINPDVDDIDSFKFGDLALKNYYHLPKITAPVSV